MPDRQLILASSSIYRRSLLERLQRPFTCVSPDINEAPLLCELPAATAMRLAQTKSHAVAAAYPQALIIGSDQVAILEGPVTGSMAMGKPGNHANAVRQLRAMRGKRMLFHTAVCLLDAASGRQQLENVVTTVHFRDATSLTDAQIDRYLQLEQPYDCAGSAKIESLGIALAQKIECDDPTAIIGLPLISLVSMLKREGVEVI